MLFPQFLLQSDLELVYSYEQPPVLLAFKFLKQQFTATSLPPPLVLL